MKYVIVLGDGMADLPVEELQGLTPLEFARTPCMDSLAAAGEIGTVHTIPDGMAPGSDTANLSVLGYDPQKYYSGRSPLEALSIGVDMKPTDVSLRCNLVTLSDEADYAQKTMLDYSAGEISTEEARELICFLKKEFDKPPFTLYAGISYRHCLVIDRGRTGETFIPPHDISDKKITNFLPSDGVLTNMMKRSYELLKDHPVNAARKKSGKNPANSVWFWGEGTKPNMKPFYELYGKRGGVISAVDLVKGLGILADMQIIPVNNITGNWNTDFQGKANCAVNALLGGLDFVYLHMEAPDECGHHGDTEKKIYSIEQIDGVVRTVCERLNEAGEDYALLLLPDHPTPIALKTHVSDPVPFLLYRSDNALAGGAPCYDEAQAEQTGYFIPRGHELIKLLFQQ